VIDALAALIFVYFFLMGLLDGTVSSFNILLWLGILGGLAVVLGGSAGLKKINQPGLAITLLLFLAIPAIFALLFLIYILISNPRWN
jgi:hypothetical protein